MNNFKQSKELYSFLNICCSVVSLFKLLIKLLIPNSPIEITIIKKGGNKQRIEIPIIIPVICQKF